MVDRIRTMVELLRRGATARAAEVRAQAPGEWLPEWVGGNPWSRSLRSVHQVGGLLRAVEVDDRYAWAVTSGGLHRVALADGAVRRIPLEGGVGHLGEAVFTGGRVVGITDDRLLMWDVADGRLLVSTDPDDVPLPAGALCGLAAGDGVAVTGTRGGYLLTWDLSDGRRRAKAAAHTRSVFGVSVHDGVVLSLCYEDGEVTAVRFSEVAGLGLICEATVRGEAFAPTWTVLDGRAVGVTLDGDGVLTVWDPAAAVPLAEFPTGGSPMTRPVFTADGAGAVVAGAEAVHVVDLRDGALRGTVLTDIDHGVDYLAVHGPWLYAGQGGSTEGRTNLFDLSGPPAADPPVRQACVDAAAAVVDGRPAVVALGRDSVLRTFGAVDGREIREPVGEPAPFGYVMGADPRLRTAHGGGRVLVTTVEETSVLDPGAGRTVRAGQVGGPGTVSLLGPGFAGFARAVASSTEQAAVAPVATVEGLVTRVVHGFLELWDTTTATLRARVALSDSGDISAVAVGDCGGRVVVVAGGWSGGLRFFAGADLSEIDPPGRFAVPGAVTGLQVRGEVVVCAVGDPEARTVSRTVLATGEPAGPSLAHPEAVRSFLAAEIGGSEVVVTLCSGGRLRVWDAAAGTVRADVPLPGRVEKIVAVAGDRVVLLREGTLVALGRRPRP